MLPAGHRLRRPADFTSTTRAQRAGRPALVAYLALGSPTDTTPALVGFTVSKAVGGSVVRHRVTRRLREAVRPLIGTLPPGARLVVRALPAAADASVADLRAQITSAVQSIQQRTGRS